LREQPIMTPEEKRCRFQALAQQGNLCTGQELANSTEDQGQLLLFDSANRPLVFCGKGWQARGSGMADSKTRVIQVTIESDLPGGGYS
jgi:hypothetical protein